MGEGRVSNIRLRDLVKAARDINMKLKVKPPLDIATDEADLELQLLEVADPDTGIIRPTDHLLKKTRDVLDELLRLDKEEAVQEVVKEEPKVQEAEIVEEEVKETTPPESPEAIQNKMPRTKTRRVLEYLTPLIEEGEYTRKQLKEKAVAHFSLPPEGEDTISESTIHDHVYGCTKKNKTENKFGRIAAPLPASGVLVWTEEIPK